MLTTFVLVQTGVNLLLIVALFLLLRERRVSLRLSLAREDRLEALAAEFCALGREVVAGGADSSGSGAIRGASGEPELPGPGRAGSHRGLATPEVSPAAGVPAEPSESDAPPREAKSCGEPGEARSSPRSSQADRLTAAVALLDQGFSVEAVAGRTAIPDGEVQVLRNLRKINGTPSRRRRPRCAGGKPDTAKEGSIYGS
jgi:hypothetical protein